MGVRWLQTKGKGKDAGNDREFKKQTDVFERRTTAGSGLFGTFGGGFANIFGQVVSIRGQRQYEERIWKSSKFKMVNVSLQVDVRHSKTPLLNLLNAGAAEDELLLRLASLSQLSNRENDQKKGFIYEAVSLHAPFLLQFSEVYRSILGWLKEAVSGNLTKFWQFV